MPIEQSLILIKPDAVNRSVTGRVLTRLEDAHLELIAVKLVKVPDDLAKEHYAQHIGKNFFPTLLEYITGRLHGPPHDRVLALVYRGENAIKALRSLSGDTNPEKADRGTIRAMFGRITTGGVMENVVHASATPLEAEREIKLWFKPDEIIGDIYPTKKNGQVREWTRIPSVSELG
jgi:nucleoside-diphosphate kinase